MRESIKIGGAVLLMALLAADIGIHAESMLGEAERPPSPKPSTVQEKRNAETQSAEAGHNHGNAEGQQQPSNAQSPGLDEPHPQAAQKKADAPASGSDDTPNQESVLNPWQPAFNLLLVRHLTCGEIQRNLTRHIKALDAAIVRGAKGRAEVS
jgi:hypothetical protein